MSGGISASTALMAAGAAAAVYTVTQSGKKPASETLAAPTPVAPPQASQTPTPAALRKKNATAEGGPGMSSSSTLLTGPSGVDSSLLNLGKATLLGQ